MGVLSVEALMPIRDVFSVNLQTSTPTGCNVEVHTTAGETFVFRLPYGTSTAMLFSQIKNAKDAYGRCGYKTVYIDHLA